MTCEMDTVLELRCAWTGRVPIPKGRRAETEPIKLLAAAAAVAASSSSLSLLLGCPSSGSCASPLLGALLGAAPVPVPVLSMARWSPAAHESCSSWSASWMTIEKLSAGAAKLRQWGRPYARSCSTA